MRLKSPLVPVAWQVLHRQQWLRKRFAHIYHHYPIKAPCPVQPDGIGKFNQAIGTIGHYSTTMIACSGTFGHGEYQIKAVLTP